MSIEYADRYTATGIPYPDPTTMCPGPCEGMGVVPVRLEVAPVAPGPRPHRELSALEQAFLDAVETGTKPDDLGYIFVTCPTCKGTRLRA